MSLFPRGSEVLCWRVYVRWSVSLFHFIAFACHLSIFCCRDRISHSSMLCCHLSLCYPIWLLSLPVISFFEGDDAKMLFFFSLSKAPLGLFLFHVKKIYICDALYQRACKYCKPIPGFAFMCLGFVGWMSGMRSVSFHLVVTGRMNAFKKTKTTLHKKPFTEVLNFL